MASTIFYSWQSDSPSSVNRNFIKDAIQKAINKVVNSAGIEEAPRLDQDTAGIPGTPEIVNAILEKIENCSVFVPDLTIVAHTDEKEPTPNPNVLIEYGYAMKTCGSMRIISMMNEAFGSAEKCLPFDLKHRRWPIRYTLREGDNPEIRKKQKDLLIAQLEEAFRTISQAGLFDKVQESTSEAFPIWKSSSFLENGENLAKAMFPDRPDMGRYIVWQNGPQAFLRIIPVKPVSKTHLELENLIRNGNLSKMGDSGNADWILRNKYGAVYVGCDDSGKPDTFLRALSLTQVFPNGEIWGIEGHVLREKALLPQAATEIHYIPAGYMEKLFAKTLQSYLEWAKVRLKLELPLKYVLGLSSIEEYSISVNSNDIHGYCVKDEIIAYGEIIDYDTDIAKILLPFYQDIWESCGIKRPDIRR